MTENASRVPSEYELTKQFKQIMENVEQDDTHFVQHFPSQTTEEKKMKKGSTLKKIIGLVALALIVITGFASIRTVQAGEVGVVRRFGQIQENVLTEGVNFVVPFIDRVNNESIRVRLAEFDTSAASQDLVDVRTSFAVNYMISPDAVIDIHRNVGVNFEDVILYPAIQETMKFTTSRFSAEELVTRRSEVSTEAADYLATRMEPFGIRITAINITDLRFSHEFTLSIEQRQVAEQRVLTAQQELELARVEGEQELVRARAEADAMAILNSEITPELLQRLFIERWNGVMPMAVGENSNLLQLPMNPSRPTTAQPEVNHDNN